MDLLVLAKEPIPGRVKTRLGPTCSPAEAAALAEASLADTLANAVRTGADRVVLVLDGRPGVWCPSGVVVIPQVGGSLAERLAAAWSDIDGPALQMGMDTPQADPVTLDRAMSVIDTTGGSVIGLADDGGWWAVGMHRPDPDAILGIPTSRADTGDRQLRRLRHRGHTVDLLPSARDVDTWADAIAVAASVPGSAFAAAVAAVAGRRST
ncbi:MAG: DUF2064 domain-containing protein, partial [Acidimicrobiia bacterium]|nr:DUF2064 domain-containing protein [Acidimicrobiia bacterium]